MLDLVIRGGTVVDGTGAVPRAADVGVKDGRIVEIGEISSDAAETIDATGLVVSPGFVDIHTHYDAQVLWDPFLSPSSGNGVTSVFAGNCGFTIAPLAADYAEYLMRMMSAVEGIPLEALRNGLDWDWASFKDYLGKIEGNVAVNIGVLAGHSPIRLAVMGEAARTDQATPEQIAQMRELLRRCIAEGAVGFSSSISPTHVDLDGRPVPSRAASKEELLALAETAGEFDGTLIELGPRRNAGDFYSDGDIDFMSAMSQRSDRVLNWNLLVIRSADDKIAKGQLAPSIGAAERGAGVIVLTLPTLQDLFTTFVTGAALHAVTGWSWLFQLPLEERITKLSDPEVRKTLAESAMTGRQIMPRWDTIRVSDTVAPENRPYEGLTLAEIAEQRGGTLFEALFDVVVADKLVTSLSLPMFTGDDTETWQARAGFWRNRHVMIGGSDAGAHMDQMCGGNYTTKMIGELVRDQGLISLEEAVHMITDAPARLYGLRERGRIQVGWHADLAVFDLNTVGSGSTYRKSDLPGGAWRFYSDPVGVEHVVVNGTPIIRNGQPTESRPGLVLKPGRDTETVTAAMAPQ